MFGLVLMTRSFMVMITRLAEANAQLQARGYLFSCPVPRDASFAVCEPTFVTGSVRPSASGQLPVQAAGQAVQGEFEYPVLGVSDRVVMTVATTDHLGKEEAEPGMDYAPGASCAEQIDRPALGLDHPATVATQCDRKGVEGQPGQHGLQVCTERRFRHRLQSSEIGLVEQPVSR
jgi:hypothetical protein